MNLSEIEKEKSRKLKSFISRGVVLKSNDRQRVNDDLKKIHETWKTIDLQINDPNSLYILKTKHDAQSRLGRRFRPIRVFVSSTFTDFFSEREILVKQFFPELREWCQKRNLDLIECDLRWGVPADTTSDNTILTCLRELDRCYKDNDGQPFFIGLLGEKYGWVPDMTKLSKELVNEFNWIPNISITFMEYLHGFLRSKNSNACVFIRSKETLNGLPGEFNDKFFETVPLSKLQLQVEKEKLRKEYKNQVVEYSGFMDGFDETTGRKRPKISGLENFGQQVLSFLKRAISRTYPDARDLLEIGEQSSLDVYNQKVLELSILNERYMNEKNEFFIGLKDEVDMIVDFLQQGKISNRFNSIEVVDQTKNEYQEKQLTTKIQTLKPLIILGDEGCGKTALLSCVMNKLKESSNDDVFCHMFNSSTSNRTMRSFYARFLTLYSKKLGVKNIEIELSDDKQQAIEDFNAFFKDQLMDSKFKKIIIIDDWDYGMTHDWLKNFNSQALDDSFRVVFTAKSSEKSTISYILGQSSFYSMHLSYFNKDMSKQYIEKFLGKYNKKLDDKQMSNILSKSESNNNTLSPLWLSYVCNELKIFGEFSTINKKIEKFPIDQTELIVQILNRVNADFPNNIVIDILCFITYSYMGIPEAEFGLLLSQINKNLNRLEWSQIYLSLKKFLSSSEFDGSQVISLAERRLYKIVEENFVSKESGQDPNKKNPYKSRVYYMSFLVKYFRHFSLYRGMAANQCYYIYMILNQRKDLIEFLDTEEGGRFINGIMRANAYNFARCKHLASNMGTENVKMCQICSMKRGKVLWLNKDSCYVCGANVNAHSPLVYRCSKHAMQFFAPNTMFKCCFCKNLVAKASKTPGQMSVDARYCTHCNPQTCCMLDLETIEDPLPIADALQSL